MKIVHGMSKFAEGIFVCEPLNRDISLDVLRGIAIGVVVLGHALQKVYGYYPVIDARWVILSFQMELFFGISGYVAHLGVSGLKRKTLRLMIPYTLWIAMSIAYGMYTGNFDFSMPTLWRYIVVHEFWFLRELFLVSLIWAIGTELVGKLKKACDKIPMLLIVLVVVLLMLGMSMFCQFVLGQRLLTWYCGCYAVGYAIRHLACASTMRHKLVRNGVGALALVFPLMLIYISAIRDWFLGTYLIGLSAICFSIWISKAISQTDNLVQSWLSFCGKESLAIYALHWWLLFKLAPLPGCIDSVPKVDKVLLVCVSWWAVILVLDAIISQSRYLRFCLLGKKI